eukprot:gnl/TRDRNA2_/TRDRNA2_107041_c0_seq1.p2 gnl/TRDRNA2_/TRDRNA2_107041_c0~~gnl/TRDRNA2_/TRDRNA2_107041_c0_seq1.p2  ORF type:complete len:166 (-),score=24.54 gnl/TRDRNA2_/TRDRNA2_107041_c0_seq1:20-517(-)
MIAQSACSRACSNLVRTSVPLEAHLLPAALSKAPPKGSMRSMLSVIRSGCVASAGVIFNMVAAGAEAHMRACDEANGLAVSQLARDVRRGGTIEHGAVVSGTEFKCLRDAARAAKDAGHMNASQLAEINNVIKLLDDGLGRFAEAHELVDFLAQSATVHVQRAHS